MTHKEEFSSEFDIYLSDILDRLREKYGYASVNRLMKGVRFYYHKPKRLPYPFSGFKIVVKEIEIHNSVLQESMKNKTLPKEIQELL